MASQATEMPAADLNLFLVIYEVVARDNGEAPAHAALRDLLDGYPVRTKLTDSAWIVRTPRSVTAVFEALDGLLAPDDRLFVGALTGEAAWRNIERGYDWLTEAFEPGGPTAIRAV